ncbi:MAG TPA: hypothetical protein VKE22_23790 [Haliangiales bacterium]|nr:hypothetical protein [Haliangiales bacterium]
MTRLVAFACLLGCKVPDPPPIGDTPWEDRFERSEVGADYVATDSVYEVRGGALRVEKAYNQPLWLRKKLPADAEIDLDVRSMSPAGDIKVEIWGDGESKARDRGAYTSTGYVFIFGGWSNTRSILARLEEHGRDLVARSEPKVEPGRTYHWKIVKGGGHIEWSIDGQKFLAYDDANPLSGPGHEYLGFNDWEAEVWFDNLVIKPIK